MFRTYLKYLIPAVMLLITYGCKKQEAAQKEAEHAAVVHNPVEETSLTAITLSSAAEQRLGIETVAVENRTIAKSRTFGGEIVTASGCSVVVAAPLSGTILLPEEGPAVSSGSIVTKDQPLFRLLLALPQQDQDMLAIREQISILEAERKLAEKNLSAKQVMYEDQAASDRELLEAQTEYERINTSLDIARTRLQMLESGDITSQTEELSSLVIKAPVDGIIQNVHVAAGQTVTNATALLEISDIDPVWIKVPVYAGDIETIEPNEPARIHNLNDFTGTNTRTAQPVTASLTADADSATVDLFYEISNSDLSYRPGQKIGVTLTLKTEAQSLVVPYASILYDMYGGTWVYENTAPLEYTRQRVELHRIQGDYAVLSRGPEVGARIVTAGSVELFGTEFGESGGH